MLVDRHSSDKFRPEYDVLVRRLPEVLAPTSARKEALGMAISEFTPGETVREHVNKPQVEEVFLILAGTVEVTIGGESEVLVEGDLSYAPIDVPHRFTNVGTDTARLLSIWWRVVPAEAEAEAGAGVAAGVGATAVDVTGAPAVVGA